MNRNDWRERRNLEDSAPCLAGTPARNPNHRRQHKTQVNPNKKFSFQQLVSNPSEMSKQTTHTSNSEANSKNWMARLGANKGQALSPNHKDWGEHFKKRETNIGKG